MFSANTWHFSNCIFCFASYDCFRHLVFDLSKLLRIWSFAFCNSACFLFGFQIGFCVFVFCSNSLLPALVFCLSLCAQFIPTCGRFFGCLQIVSAYNFCFGIYALHIRIFAVTDCGFLSLKGLPVHWYHLFVPI